MNAKRTTPYWLVIILIFSLILSACGPKAEDISLDLVCTSSADCALTVENGYRSNVDYSVEVATENQNSPIGETTLYTGTQAERHSSFYYGYRAIFNHSDTLASGEVESYNVNNVQGEGLTLVKMTVRVNKGGFSEPIILTRYQLLSFPLSNADEQPIKNTLTCSNGRIVARTELVTGTLDQNMAIYLNGNIEEAYTTFIVKDGAYAEINLPMPEGVQFIELDVNGHRSPYTNKEQLKEAHRFRAYCIPPQ